jgi:hypothetical protein
VHRVLTAAAAAAAALNGPLFVAVWLRPETVFGDGAPPAGRAQADSAFTCLADSFFVSPGGARPPGPSRGAIAIIMSVSSLLATIRLHREAARQELQIVPLRWSPARSRTWFSWSSASSLSSARGTGLAGMEVPLCRLARWQPRLAGMFVPAVGEMVELRYEFDQDRVAGDSACTAVLGDHAAPLAGSLAATVTSCDPRRTGPACRCQGRVTPRGGTGAGSPGSA